MHTSGNTNLIKELALLGLLALLWGSSYLLIKVAVAEIPPLTLIAARVVIAAAVLLIVLAWQHQTIPLLPALWGMLLVQAFLNSIGAWTLLAWGQQHIDSSLAAVLNSTSPLFVFFITLLVTRHEDVHPIRLAGALLGLVGVTLIVGLDALAGLGQQVAGQLAALVSAILYACAAIYGRRFTTISATATAAGTMIMASVVLVPISLAVDQPWTIRPSSQALVAAACLGVFSTGVALMIYFRLIRTLGSLGVASQGYLRAGFGVALGVLVLGETITPMVAVGVFAAIAGVALINIPRRTPPTGG